MRWDLRLHTVRDARKTIDVELTFKAGVLGLGKPAVRTQEDGVPTRSEDNKGAGENSVVQAKARDLYW